MCEPSPQPLPLASAHALVPPAMPMTQMSPLSPVSPELVASPASPMSPMSPMSRMSPMLAPSKYLSPRPLHYAQQDL